MIGRTNVSGGGGKISCELLWSNPNPNSSIGAFTINGLSGKKALGYIVSLTSVFNESPAGIKGYNYVPVSDTVIPVPVPLVQQTVIGYGGNPYQRDVWAYEDRIEFGDGGVTSRAIPQQVWELY